MYHLLIHYVTSSVTIIRTGKTFCPSIVDQPPAHLSLHLRPLPLSPRSPPTRGVFHLLAGLVLIALAVALPISFFYSLALAPPTTHSPTALPSTTYYTLLLPAILFLYLLFAHTNWLAFKLFKFNQ